MRGGVVRSRQWFESYATTFTATENPISEGSRWRNGLTHAADWSDVQTSGGRAYGTQSGVIGPPYNDSVAIIDPLPGRIWSPNQQVIANVFITDRVGWASFKEVECILRAVMSSGSIKLYEVLFSVVAGTTYAQIMRWNGPVGQDISDFEEIGVNNAWSGLSDGTFVRGLIAGNTIEGATSTNGTTWTTIVNGNIVTDASDGISYATGAPGIGFWNRDPTQGANNTFGFNDWAATSL